MEASGASLPSGYKAIPMSNIGQWTHIHTCTRLHTDHPDSLLLALGEQQGEGGNVEEKRASVTVRPKLTASTLVAVGLVPSQCSVTFPQSALQHTSTYTHTHTQMELPAGLIVSLDDPYESHCPYSSQKKTHTLIFPLFSLTIKINTCSQNKLFTGGMQGHDFLLQWVFPPHLSKFDFCLLPFPQFLWNWFLLLSETTASWD